jgi:hypothetical protein
MQCIISRTPYTTNPFTYDGQFKPAYNVTSDFPSRIL